MSSHQYALTIVKKKGKDGMRVPLDSLDDITFGRDESCNIRIQKPSISGLHTRIFYDTENQVRVAALRAAAAAVAAN